MNSRERVFAALNHQQPDRCPVDFTPENATLETLKRYFQVDTQQEVMDQLDVDLQFVFPRCTLKREPLPDGSWYSDLGTHLHPVQNAFCTYAEHASYPLADVEDVSELDQFDKWPSADNYDFAGFSDAIGSAHEKRVTKLHAGGLYEVAWALRGQSQFLMDMITEPDIARGIMERICTFWCDFITRALESAGDKIDIVYTYDDIAAQNSLIMSPDMLREFVLPYHQRVAKVIRSFGKKVMYHTCGAVTPVIDDLLTIPIHILNPLQPRAAGMDFAAIKEKWGDKLVFHGGIDTQVTLPTGTPEDVRKEVRHAIWTLGKNGGYILSSAHNIQNDTPVENILAMYDVSLR